MKVYLSVDMEGMACIVHPVQVIPPSLGPQGGFQPDARTHERGRKLLIGEVKAAVDGAHEAGATLSHSGQLLVSSLVIGLTRSEDGSPESRGEVRS